MSDLTANLQEIASNAKAWPFAEARALASRLDKMGDATRMKFCLRPVMAHQACRILVLLVRLFAPRWFVMPLKA